MRTITQMLRVWGLYFLAVPGVPRLLRRYVSKFDKDTARDSEWVLVQAFGRESYTNQELTAQLARICTAPHTLFRFAQLEKAGFRPGPANQKLARDCELLWSLNPSLVMELQWEVAYVLWSYDKQQFTKRQRQVNVIWPEGDYFATFHVTQNAAADIRRRGLDPRKGIDLAHPDMIARVLPITWKEGLDPVPWISQVPYAGPESIQPWTRNAGRWFLREILTRCHHLAHMILRRQIMAFRPRATP
jgi:hypothetical protein